MNLETAIYLAITAAALGLIVWRLFAESKPTGQATAAMVIVPLLLRLLLIK